MLRHLPDDTMGKEGMIEHARSVIIEKRRGQNNVIAFAARRPRRP